MPNITPGVTVSVAYLRSYRNDIGWGVSIIFGNMAIVPQIAG
jgi:hypothetical protein